MPVLPLQSYLQVAVLSARTRPMCVTAPYAERAIRTFAYGSCDGRGRIIWPVALGYEHHQAPRKSKLTLGDQL
jgi:hypothetical protein